MLIASPYHGQDFVNGPCRGRHRRRWLTAETYSFTFTTPVPEAGIRTSSPNLPIPVPSSQAGAAAAERPVEIEGGADQPEMRQSLREIAERFAGQPRLLGV